MGLVHVARQAASPSAGLRSSYAEISRFWTRRHGITGVRCAARGFVSSTKKESSHEENAKAEEHGQESSVQKMLDEFKSSIRSTSWHKIHNAWKTANLASVLPGQEIEMVGYLGARRDVNKKLSFAMLRNQNQTWCIQLVTTAKTEEGEEARAHARLRSLREWTPVMIRGRLMDRQPAKDDTYLGMRLMNVKEVALTHIQPLNEISNDIIIKQDTVFGPENRHLQLRTDYALRTNILVRSQAMQRARILLGETDWKEIETPILFKSTPEGAREFLVPTRNKGLAYALPQSPQQYKQILMASGFTKYFQFARCFRDEDLRADRQPEFTQLDMEMAFGSEEDVMEAVEKLLRNLWHRILKQKTPEQFPRMTYHDAMASYGSDKPDLRYKSKIYNVTEHLPADLISKITPLENPTIDAIKISVSEDPRQTRRFVSDFLDSPAGKPYLENPNGQPGVFISDLTRPMNGMGALGYQFVMEGPPALATDQGDLLILQARPTAPFSGGSTVLGNLRLALHKAAIEKGLVDGPAPTDFEFVWITDFPLFSPTTDADPGQGGSAGLSSTHHPFTAPKTPADVDLLLTDPTAATAAHYDIVVNGVELGGGSRRIHNAAVQEFIFRDVLKMQPERVEDFRHLLDVLRSGCPPHAGIALGWDRLIAVMSGSESVRDVIAFPKSGRGEDMLVKSPNRVTRAQWDMYHLGVKE